MATEVFKKLYQGQLPAAASAIYTAPTGTNLGAIIKSIRVVNTDAAASRWFILFQSGTGVANQILGRTVLGPNETWASTGPFILGSADTIGGQGEIASTLTITMSGLSIE